MGRIESTNIVIYQPGYQAFIKTVWHYNGNSKPDPDFRDKDNIVKLQRIPANFDHKKHCEEIEQALWGIHEYPYAYPLAEDRMTWDKLLEINLKAIPEKEVFLRRVEWEERRYREEKNR